MLQQQRTDNINKIINILSLTIHPILTKQYHRSPPPLLAIVDTCELITSISEGTRSLQPTHAHSLSSFRVLFIAVLNEPQPFMTMQVKLIASYSIPPLGQKPYKWGFTNCEWGWWVQFLIRHTMDFWSTDFTHRHARLIHLFPGHILGFIILYI